MKMKKEKKSFVTSKLISLVTMLLNTSGIYEDQHRTKVAPRSSLQTLVLFCTSSVQITCHVLLTSDHNI
jgi:hypothetical protein